MGLTRRQRASPPLLVVLRRLACCSSLSTVPRRGPEPGVVCHHGEHEAATPLPQPFSGSLRPEAALQDGAAGDGCAVRCVGHSTDAGARRISWAARERLQGAAGGCAGATPWAVRANTSCSSEHGVAPAAALLTGAAPADSLRVSQFVARGCPSTARPTSAAAEVGSAGGTFDGLRGRGIPRLAKGLAATVGRRSH